MVALNSLFRQTMDQQEINHRLDTLAARDEDLQRGLGAVGYPRPRIRQPGFETLLATIVSQQISTEAAATIMRRVRALLPTMRAESVLRLPAGELRAAGLSARKAEYVTSLAQAIAAGRFDPAALTDMDDRSAIEAITSLRGFGVWSAEIYLMFSLRRGDIFPAGDLALRVALQKLKGIEAPLDQRQARALTGDWAPFRSAGSLFLWHYYRGAPT